MGQKGVTLLAIAASSVCLAYVFAGPGGSQPIERAPAPSPQPAPPQMLTSCGALAGEIRAWAGPTTNIPEGWFVCDGSQVNVNDAPELFAAIGTSWGGDGVPLFNLPDLRGRFLRGVDTGSGADPDRFSRYALHAGGNSGALVGTYQEDATARPNNTFVTSSDTHSHQMMGGNRTGNSPGPGDYLQGTNNPQVYGNKSTASDTHNHYIASGGDNETRPTNVGVHFIIFGGCGLVSEPCLGDVNGDLQVNITDLGVLLSTFGQNCDPNAP